MNILKDLDFVPAAINIESIFVSDKCVIRSGLRHLVPFILWLSYLIPLLLLNFVLEQIIEVSSSFSGITAKEEKTISIRNSSRS